ncbi:hypothetical protein [Streptomyces sp. NPDC051014]|uniref:hypothetical protein n=1 Tax=Streptomyces sp. NPDC051014 TaxID=3155751 RepID=UPI0033F94365
MISALDTYLGWETPRHFKGCKRPVWDVTLRTDENEYRPHQLGEPAPKHSCAEEFCSHSNKYDRLTVRILCRSCGAAIVVRSEESKETGRTETSTKWTAYGLPPRQMAGLLLWPAVPWLDFGRASSDEPHDFVITRTGVKEVTKDTVVGQLAQDRGRRGGLLWTATAVPDPDGEFGWGTPIRWAHRNDGRGQGGSPLRTLRGAARWVGARLAEQMAGAA